MPTLILKSILRSLGLDDSPGETGGASGTETVRKISRGLESLPEGRARYIAAFAYLLSRVANADLDISDEETESMHRILVERGHLPEDQAALAVEMAKSQSRLFGGTENYLVAREFREMAGPAERRELLDCLFAVSAADGSISSAEEAQIRQLASELGFAPGAYAEVRSEWNMYRQVLQGLPGAPTESS